jgi:hypothetical protein
MENDFDRGPLSSNPDASLRRHFWMAPCLAGNRLDDPDILCSAP